MAGVDSSERKWTEQRVLAEIQAAAVDGYVKSAVVGMTVTAMSRRFFGSFVAACEAAGVKRWADRERALVCSADGCGIPVRSTFAEHCEKHYVRKWRHGHTGLVDTVIPWSTEHSHGYLLDYRPNHPLATRGQKRVYQHRAILYAALGAGPFDCYHCGTRVTWDDMHVDHLDDDPQNNAIANLVPSCPTCNTRRGADKMRRSVLDRRGLTFQGERRTLHSWAKKLGISRGSVQWRLSHGWPLERALTEPRGVTGPVGDPSKRAGGLCEVELEASGTVV